MLGFRRLTPLQLGCLSGLSLQYHSRLCQWTSPSDSSDPTYTKLVSGDSTPFIVFSAILMSLLAGFSVLLLRQWMCCKFMRHDIQLLRTDNEALEMQCQTWSEFTALTEEKALKQAIALRELQLALLEARDVAEVMARKVEEMSEIKGDGGVENGDLDNENEE
ncbi:hypothetical protein ACLMJK_008124 [Lecanora helva]